MYEFDKFLSQLSRGDWCKLDLGSECFININNNYNELYVNVSIKDDKNEMILCEVHTVKPEVCGMVSAGIYIYIYIYVCVFIVFMWLLLDYKDNIVPILSIN